MKVVRGWVATKESTKKEIGFLAATECHTAADALNSFNKTCASHFDLYFRTSDGELHSSDDEDNVNSFVDDFDDDADLFVEIYESSTDKVVKVMGPMKKRKASELPRR